MAFHVYPHPQTATLPVQPGETKQISIEQITGAAVPAGIYVKMMFIRVAASGGTSPPTLLIQAGAGAAVEVTPLPTAVRRSGGGYVGDVQLLGEANNVQQVRMGFDADTSETWQLQVKNTGGTAQEITCVVAGTIDETAQPWISAPSGLVVFHGLVNETIPQQITIANKGTGPLTFTAAMPVPPGFTVSSPLPLTIPPAGSAPLQLSFTAPAAPPGPDGSATATLDLTADPPDTTAKPGGGHNQRINLSMTTQSLEVVLLLDSSGSMAWDPIGGTPPTKPLSRWGELTSAANQFLDMLGHFAEKRGRFGIARFPAPDPLNPATYDIVTMTAIPGVSGMSAAQNLVSAINPDGSTPMGDGLDRVLSTATGYFASDQLSLAANRRWLILLSDGAHNSGTHNPVEFIAAPDGTAAAGASLDDRRVHLFAVAYGIDGHTDVDHQLMKKLASGSFGGGQVRNVDDENMTATQMAMAMRDALKAGLTPTAAPRDPAGSYPGQGEVRHEAVITPYDGKASFVLSWNTSERQRLRLELLSPAGETFSPDFVPAGITMRLGDRSHMYLIDAGFMKGRYGTWTLVVKGTAAENYVYDVLVETSLRMSVQPISIAHFAGQPITITANLTASGGPIPGASVTLTVDAPNRAVANWIAAAQVPAPLLEQAKEMLKGKDVTPILVKQVGAELAGQSYVAARTTFTLPMTDPDGTGVYRATIADTRVPERYSFTVTAVGQSEGVTFRREGALQTYVLVRPSPQYSSYDIEYTDRGQGVMTFVPKDEFGNVLQVDPATAGQFGLVDGDSGDFGELESNLDGSYTCPFSFDPDRGAEIAVQYGADIFVSSVKVNPPERLTFADTVISFKPGVFLEHARVPRPEDMLGGIIGKDQAVPLGAGGSVTVGFSGKVVAAEGGSDVTVFVRGGRDPRAFRLEALDSSRRVWVSVGESRGGTTTFRLAESGLAVTPALRVTDLSERSRDLDGRVLENPGVNVCGIGVLSTEPADAMTVD